jgi:hypothetical protein
MKTTMIRSRSVEPATPTTAATAVLVALLVSSPTWASPTAATPPKPLHVPAEQLRANPAVHPSEAVAGKPQGDWTLAWWQWMATFGAEANPANDPSGDLCAKGQSGPVWFLAGSTGERRSLRRCHIPKGKYLFLPLIQSVVAPLEAGTSACSELMLRAAKITREASALVTDIDGLRIEQLDRYRQATPSCFNPGAHAPKGSFGATAASNGYYVMLYPLPKGRHILNFSGALPGTIQSVTYQLTVD